MTLGARFSLPPLLRDFGEDEFVRKDARGGRGGAGVRNREGGGVGGDGGRGLAGERVASGRCRAPDGRDRGQCSTVPGAAKGTFAEHFHACFRVGAW